MSDKFSGYTRTIIQMKFISIYINSCLCIHSFCRELSIVKVVKFAKKWICSQLLLPHSWVYSGIFGRRKFCIYSQNNKSTVKNIFLQDKVLIFDICSCSRYLTKNLHGLVLPVLWEVLGYFFVTVSKYLLIHALQGFIRPRDRLEKQADLSWISDGLEPVIRNTQDKWPLPCWH